MLDDLTFTGKDLLISVVLGTVVYLLEVMLFSRRRRTAPDPSTLDRLATMDTEMSELRARLEALESRPPIESGLDTRGSLYAEALRMAREGSSTQELASQLGISRGEAELIVALHKAEP